MRLLSLTTTNLEAVADGRYGFGEAVHVIHGGLASGKTTFLEVIRSVPRAIETRGVLPGGSRFLRDGCDTAEVESSWRLSERELEKVRARLWGRDQADVDPVQSATWTLRRGAGAEVRADVGLDTLLRRCDAGRVVDLVDESRALTQTTIEYAARAEPAREAIRAFLPDLELSTATSSFALSDLEREVVQLASTLTWPMSPDAVVLVDAPEAHVSESMQTTLFRWIVRLAGGRQLIVATGSDEIASASGRVAARLRGARA